MLKDTNNHVALNSLGLLIPTSILRDTGHVELQRDDKGQIVGLVLHWGAAYQKLVKTKEDILKVLSIFGQTAAVPNVVEPDAPKPPEPTEAEIALKSVLG